MANAKSSEISKLPDTGNPVVTKKSLSGLDGWLAFAVIAIGANAIGYIWAFFLAISSLVGGAEGISLGIAIETLIFSLGLSVLCGLTLILLINRKKLAVLWTYITLGVSALYITVISFTTMFASTESCSYNYGGGSHLLYRSSMQRCETVGLPGEIIVILIGLIFATWAGTLLIAYYFKKSQRVKLTLTK